MVFTFLTIGVREKLNVCGASVLKYVKRKQTWRIVRDIENGMRIF
jgi:hypothetical protein